MYSHIYVIYNLWFGEKPRMQVKAIKGYYYLTMEHWYQGYL